MVIDILRGVGLCLLCMAMIALTAWLAYQLGLVSYERRDRMPFVMIGFVLGGLVTLAVCFAEMEKIK